MWKWLNPLFLVGVFIGLFMDAIFNGIEYIEGK